MEWNGALRNAEVRVDALKFNQRHELEVLQLSTNQWRCTVDRYSKELGLRMVKSATLDLHRGPTFRLSNGANEPHEFKLSDETPEEPDEDDDDVNTKVDFESVQFREKVKAFMSSKSCTMLNNCFVKLLTLRRDDAYNGRIDFGRPFFAWIQALRELEADVHVQTLELNTSYDIANMDSVYKLLSDVLHVQEYILWKDYEPITRAHDANRCDELCGDLLKKAKLVSMIGYGLDVDDTEDDGMKNVLDFVFSSPKCEELYVAAELIDGSRLIKKLLRRFRELQSTCQMVSTFTWEWGLGCACAACEADANDDWDIIDCAKPIAKGHSKAFEDVTHHRRRQLEPVQYRIAIGQLSGDVYEFKNEHDGTYLTVAVAKEDNTVQFRKGRFELVEVSADHPPDKRRRLSDNHEK